MARKPAPTEEDVFLHDIRATPGEDAPRLIYADWLDEHDRPRRAEFIRLQCRLAGTGADDPQREELLGREWELLTVYRDRWMSALPRWALKGRPHEFRRGFVGQLKVSGAELVRDAGKLFAVAPLEEVRLFSTEGKWGEIARLPQLARVTALDLSQNQLSGEDLTVLLASPHLGRLARLSLGHNWQLEEAGALARWKGLRQITHLDLTDTRLEAPALAELLLAQPGPSRVPEFVRQPAR